MLPRFTFRLLLAAIALSAAGMAQIAPCTPSAAKPCPAPATAPSALTPPSTAQKFPFPGEAATPDTSRPDTAVPDAPSAPKPSADAAHPFPTQAPDMPGADSGSSSSDGSSSSSSSNSSSNPDKTQPPLNDVGSEGKSTRRKLPKVQKLQTPDERVDEDINVAKFYFNRGNFEAAYLRSKDAAKTEPDYAEAHFSLAQAAQKMHKQDEANAEFNTYLKMSPDGRNARAARDALSGLQ